MCQWHVASASHAMLFPDDASLRLYRAISVGYMGAHMVDWLALPNWTIFKPCYCSLLLKLQYTTCQLGMRIQTVHGFELLIVQNHLMTVPILFSTEYGNVFCGGSILTEISLWMTKMQLGPLNELRNIFGLGKREAEAIIEGVMSDVKSQVPAWWCSCVCIATQ